MLFDGESRTLKNFNNYITIMTNSSDTGILWVWCFCLCCLFLIQQAALVNFMLYLNNFKILKISLGAYWRKNYISLNLRALFSWKQCKVFRIVQCANRRLGDAATGDVLLKKVLLGRCLRSATLLKKTLAQVFS